MATISGFRLVRKADGAELARWQSIPQRVEVLDGSVMIRVDGASMGWDNGIHTILATTWAVADPAPPTIATWTSFVSKFTDTEWAGVQKAINNQVTGGNGALARFIALATVNGVDMSQPQTTTYKNQLVAAAILTQARADVIFVAP